MTRDLPLEVVSTRHRDAVVLAVRGELDLSTVDSLRDALHSSEAQASTVVLDLRQLQFIDSSGLSLIVAEQHRAQEDGFSLAVAVGGASAVKRLFELTGLQGILTLVEDPEAVVAS